MFLSDFHGKTLNLKFLFIAKVNNLLIKYETFFGRETDFKIFFLLILIILKYLIIEFK